MKFIIIIITILITNSLVELTFILAGDRGSTVVISPFPLLLVVVVHCDQKPLKSETTDKVNN